MPFIGNFSFWDCLVTFRVYEYVSLVFPVSDFFKEEFMVFLALFYENIVLGCVDSVFPDWRFYNYGVNIGMSRIWDIFYYRWYPSESDRKTHV